MIQMYFDNLLVIGITRKNIEKLQQGQPIMFTPQRTIAGRIGIVFGEDKPAILAEMEKAGVTFHAEMKKSAEADPL